MDIKRTLELCVKINRPCLLVGKHGTGKSFSVSLLAQEQKKKIHKIVLTSETTPEDIVGTYTLKNASTEYEDMPLMQALKNGDWIVFEEINAAQASILTLLNGLIETDVPSRTLSANGKNHTPHKDFRLFATANPTEYAGTQMMNEALLSRFIVYEVNPDYKAFFEIVEKMFPGKINVIDKTKVFLLNIQKAAKMNVYISPREVLTYAHLISENIPHDDAIELIVSRFYDMDDKEKETLKSVFGVNTDPNNIVITDKVEIQKQIAKEVQTIKGLLQAMETDRNKARAEAETYRRNWEQEKSMPKGLNPDDIMKLQQIQRDLSNNYAAIGSQMKEAISKISAKGISGYDMELAKAVDVEVVKDDVNPF